MLPKSNTFLISWFSYMKHQFVPIVGPKQNTPLSAWRLGARGLRLEWLYQCERPSNSYHEIFKSGLLANCSTTCLNVLRMWHIKAMGKQKNKQPQPTNLTKQEAQTNMVDFDHKLKLNVLI